MTRYELVERIGAGAVAEIFKGRAVAAGGFEKPVAIKRILPHLSEDSHFVELLIAEAHILSHLRHRNIVQIFDVGQDDEAQHFLVMEYVNGTDLGALQKGLEGQGVSMPMHLGLYIGSEVCEALEYARTARGPDGQPMRLVHRDVSPSNIMLSVSGEVKLTDFGIAKRPEDVTRHGGVRGKFAYISPEQAFSRRVDARSDVYSLGIVLFELLVGRRLFSQLADLDALRSVREGRVPRPADVNPNLPPDIDRILMKSLALDPDARYASAGELGRELREFRYSMTATSADPAKEIAELVQRARSGEGRPKSPRIEEHTVVKLVNPSGLSLHSGESFGETSVEQTYVGARELLGRFEEEEVTRAVHLDIKSLDQGLDGTLDGDLVDPPDSLDLQPSLSDDEPTYFREERESDQIGRPGPVMPLSAPDQSMVAMPVLGARPGSGLAPGRPLSTAAAHADSASGYGRSNEHEPEATYVSAPPVDMHLDPAKPPEPLYPRAGGGPPAPPSQAYQVPGQQGYPQQSAGYPQQKSQAYQAPGQQQGYPPAGQPQGQGYPPPSGPQSAMYAQAGGQTGGSPSTGKLPPTYPVADTGKNYAARGMHPPGHSPAGQKPTNKLFFVFLVAGVIALGSLSFLLVSLILGDDPEVVTVDAAPGAGAAMPGAETKADAAPPDAGVADAAPPPPPDAGVADAAPPDAAPKAEAPAPKTTRPKKKKRTKKRQR